MYFSINKYEFLLFSYPLTGCSRWMPKTSPNIGNPKKFKVPCIKSLVSQDEQLLSLTADIPQMFAKIQQFFTLSFFLKIAFPIQAYFLEILHFVVMYL